MNGSLDDLFRGLPLLEGLPRSDVARLPFQRVEREAGESFFLQDDPADAIFGVVTGRVNIVRRAPSGREMVLEVLGPGDAVGVVAVIRKVPMPARCMALDPATLVRVPATSFLDLLDRHPGVVSRLLDDISRRLLDAGRSSGS